MIVMMISNLIKQPTPVSDSVFSIDITVFTVLDIPDDEISSVPV